MIECQVPEPPVWTDTDESAPAARWRDPTISADTVLTDLLAAAAARLWGPIAATAPPGSPLALVADHWEEESPTAMRWSLGKFGDLLWMMLPEARGAIVARLVTELTRAAKRDSDLSGLLDLQLADDVVEPLLLSALSDLPTSRGLAERCCTFLLVALRFTGGEGACIRAMLEDGVLSRLHHDQLRSIDPVLAATVERCEFW